jgi:hypothetical protein
VIETMRSLITHLEALGEPLYLAPIPCDRVDRVRLAMELDRVNYMLIPMGIPVHVVSDSASLPIYARELTSLIRPQHLTALLPLALGKITMSETWSAIVSRAAQRQGVELVGGLQP